MRGAKVDLLVTDDGDGLWGAQQHLLRLAAYYEDAGFVPTLATSRDSELGQAWSDAGRAVIDLRGLARLPPNVGLQHSPRVAKHAVRVAQRAREVASDARRLGIGLLLANSAGSHLDVAAAGRLAQVPSVLMLHEQLPRVRLRRAAVQGATCSIAVSEAVAEGVGPRARKKIAVIHNGVDTTAFTPGPSSTQMRAELAADPTEWIVGSLGRLDPMKQVDHIVEAVAAINGRGRHQVQLAVIGESSVGPAYERELRARAEHRLGNKVRFLGPRSDIVPILRSLDAIAITGRWEGLPLSLLEALAVGCPVVAYPAAGVTEVIEDGVSGLVAPMGDQRALGILVERIFDVPDLRDGLRKAGRARVEEAFTLVGQASQNVALLRGAVRGDRPGAASRKDTW